MIDSFQKSAIYAIFLKRCLRVSSWCFFISKFYYLIRDSQQLMLRSEVSIYP